MNIVFDVMPEEGQRAAGFYAAMSSHPMVLTRHRRNVLGEHAPVDECEFWEALISALLTTQQRSGPRSAVTRFIRSTPFPVSLSECRSCPNVRDLVESRLTAHGGIRRAPSIGGQVAANLVWLEAGGWGTLLTRVRVLEGAHDWSTERDVARHLASHLAGIGPKQSRNVLQMLGVTQFETPLDSRVTKWLNGFGFPIRLDGAILSSEAGYGLVADGFRALCGAAGVLPCNMDAAIFASEDGQDYGKEVVRW